MSRFEVLTGLPPYGPTVEPFSYTRGGAHREGYVVRFTDSNGGHWVGNFEPRFGGIDAVCEHPDGRRLVVISGGQGYIVDPDDRTRRESLDCEVRDVLPVPGRGLLLGDGLGFVFIGPAGTLWTSSRISWDGMRALRVDGLSLTGEAWDALTDHWLPFELDILTGNWKGGAFKDEWTPYP